MSAESHGANRGLDAIGRIGVAPGIGVAPAHGTNCPDPTAHGPHAQRLADLLGPARLRRIAEWLDELDTLRGEPEGSDAPAREAQRDLRKWADQLECGELA